jgi:hypothetical protein
MTTMMTQGLRLGRVEADPAAQRLERQRHPQAALVRVLRALCRGTACRTCWLPRRLRWPQKTRTAAG